MAPLFAFNARANAGNEAKAASVSFSSLGRRYYGFGRIFPHGKRFLSPIDDFDGAILAPMIFMTPWQRAAPQQ